MAGTITSADDGTNIPSNNGFEPKDDFVLTILNGTTIDADLQVKTGQGNWVKVPDDSSNTDITAGFARPISAAPGMFFRINVTTATGTWDWDWYPKKDI